MINVIGAATKKSKHLDRVIQKLGNFQEVFCDTYMRLTKLKMNIEQTWTHTPQHVEDNSQTHSHYQH